ncbi:alpha-tectorin-like [Chelmon rostratus]|uniref:alpha-tectorin-like n=1 Tax=Chelmon rostratus TaxID=109905 RepID=UPI001BED344B|nr:alpha-tectorin-like [Chelmon rostratus]
MVSLSKEAEDELIPLVNFVSGKLIICFDAFYDSSQTAQDCILGPPVSGQTASWATYGYNVYYENLYRSTAPSILNDLECDVEIADYSDTSSAINLANFGTQAVLRFFFNNDASFSFEALVDGEVVDTFNFTSAGSTKIEQSVDISGCRHSDVMYKPGTNASDPQTCFSLTCNETAALRTTECGPLDRCQGNGVCKFVSICTVTGSAVIDFNDQLKTVEDRCGYTLLTGSPIENLTVVANFQERRRRDVSFLDSVTLRLQGQDHVHLEQGGTVKEGNTTLTINGSTDLGNGVEVFVDPTGVTVTVSHPESTTSVFFDGNTAQIFLIGPAGQDPELGGLCASSTSVSDERLPEDNGSSCEVQYNDTADSSINCTMMTERCNLLLEEPFTACHNHTDPESYVNACIDTLCKYPAVDGLNCQFLEAYASDCRLRSNDTLDSWRSTAGCSPPQPFCQGRICSDHEFCAETISGGIGCFCRAIFAFPYRSNDTVGDPTVCEENSASVTVVGCLLEEKGIDYTMLHLNDPTCTGQIDELDHMVTFSFNSSNTCGTEVMANNSQLIYMNSIVGNNSVSDNITRQDQVYIDFSCVFTQPDVNTVTFRIKDSSVIQEFASGTWNYTLTMKAYTDAGHTQAVESITEVQLNQQIWVVLETGGLDGSLVAVVTDSCWATDQAESLRYNLIVDGCANPDDQTVNVVGNGVGTSNYFSFHMFQFSRSAGDIHLHCKLNLCANLNQTCTPNCNGASRRRRSATLEYEDEAPAFISMTWTH